MDEEHVKKLTHLFLFNKQISKDDTDCFLCNACQIIITDEFYLRVGSKIYHESCLQCSICQIRLNKQSTCFLKGLHILCRKDYYKYFANKCSKCDHYIYSNDWVRRACEYVYHLTCFACYICKRQLSTGEEYALENDGQILCKMHFIKANEDKNNDNERSRTKRIRTAFTEEQLHILQANFEVDPNPDGQNLEWIAQIAGLNKRVIQVWFQNTRARQKKIQTERFQQKLNHRRNKHKNSSSSISNETVSKRTKQIRFENIQTHLKRELFTH